MPRSRLLALVGLLRLAELLDRKTPIFEREIALQVVNLICEPQ
jgi:hypothetical protein